MKSSEGPGWLIRIQNLFLPLAKGIYIFGALGSLLTVICGIIFVIYLQALIARPAKTVAIPPPYSASQVSMDDMAIQLIDGSLIDRRLAPPTNIRFKVTTGTITAPFREDEDVMLGYFEADTVNGLASSRDGISIIGGADSDLFEQSFNQRNQKISLKAKAALINEINQTLRDIKDHEERNFELLVVARDQYKIRSEATTISFPLRFGPKAMPASPTPEPTSPSEMPRPEPTKLENIAGQIAEVVAPEARARIDAYRIALETPKKCGTGERDEVFVSTYRQAFEQARTKLTAENVEAFYKGVCEVWKERLGREAAARVEAEKARVVARRQAEEARAEAIAINNEARATHQAQVIAAQAKTYLTLSVIGGALAAFLTITVIVAFLAIEGHSRAIRQAVEAMGVVSEAKNEK